MKINPNVWDKEVWATFCSWVPVGKECVAKKEETGYRIFVSGEEKGSLPLDLPIPANTWLLQRRERKVEEMIGDKKVEKKIEEFFGQIFADLHRNSYYSILESVISVSEMVEHTPITGAVTDQNGLFASVAYQKAMAKQGKRSILGLEISHLHGDDVYSLVLLATSQEGWKTLVELSTLAFQKGQENPYVTAEELASHTNGVLCLTGGKEGFVYQGIYRERYEDVEAWIHTLESYYGKGNVYLEWQRHQLKEEKGLHRMYRQLERNLRVKSVATSGAFFTYEGDAPLVELARCIKDKEEVDESSRGEIEGENYHLMTQEEIWELYKDEPKLLANSIEVAERCKFALTLNEVFMPVFEVPAPFTDEEAYFRHLCMEGFNNRFQGTPMLQDEEYIERLQFEMDTILKMGFPGYFLIVADFMRFAKESNILTGPGRGSACGSLVAFVLGITEVDPIPYGLLFERFLNPDRISMPDVDLDFQDDRRDEVINYVRGKYGYECVSRIIAVGTLQAKKAVKDVIRASGLPYKLGERLSKLVPANKKLKEALQESEELQAFMNQNSTNKELIEFMLRLEGKPRNISVHACGVLISKGPVRNYMPQVVLENATTKKVETTTQFSMGECEEMGLLKMDFLGLRTMSVISHALHLINEKREKQGEEKLSLDSIPINDLGTYEYISKGQTQGIFQLESSGMTSFMKELFQDIGALKQAPKEEHEAIGDQLFERLVAGISLYRPGPIDEIPFYIQKIIDPRKITYDVPELEPILSKTYGTIIYQEQVMQTVRSLAGFTRGQADTIRKGMAKKVKEVLEEYGQYFVHGSKEKGIVGCVANGISEQSAIALWEKMKKFSEYAFNKSHGVAYAVISAKTAYLACYYPVEYMCATLNSYVSKQDKLRFYLSACEKKGIDVWGPSINESEKLFSVHEVNGESIIRFGLEGVRSVGASASEIIAVREKHGNFPHLQGFIESLDRQKKLKKTVVENLIYAGALDDLPETRHAKVEMVPIYTALSKATKVKPLDGQLSFFEDDLGGDIFNAVEQVKIEPKEEFDQKYILDKEYHTTGFYLSGHPIDVYQDIIAQLPTTELGSLFVEETDEEIGEINESGFEETIMEKDVMVVGVLSDLVTMYTKKDGKAFASFTIEDKTGSIRSICFSQTYDRVRDSLEEKEVYQITGRFIAEGDFGPQLIVQDIVPIDSLVLTTQPRIAYVQVLEEEERTWIQDYIRVNSGNKFTKVKKENERKRVEPAMNHTTIWYKYKNAYYETTQTWTLAIQQTLQDKFGERLVVRY